MNQMSECNKLVRYCVWDAIKTEDVPFSVVIPYSVRMTDSECAAWVLKNIHSAARITSIE